MVQLSSLKETNLYNIPQDWRVVSLQEVATINPESITKDYPYEEIEYIDIGCIENYQITKYECFGLNKRPSRAQRIVRKNDIIVSTVRPYLHGFARITDSKPGLVCSTGFAVLRCHDSQDVDFIFNFIKSGYFESQLNVKTTGLAYPAVTSKIVGSALLGFPKNKIEAQKIGEILSKVDELIRKTIQIIEQTQRLKKGLMQKLLTKGIGHKEFIRSQIGTLPAQWNVVQLNEVCTKIIDMDHKMPMKTEEGIAFVSVGYLNKSSTIHFDIDNSDRELEYISNKDFLNYSKRFNAERDDLLISRYGTIGVVKLINTDQKFLASYSIALIKPNRNAIIPLFLAYFLNSSVVKNQVLYMTQISSNTNLGVLDINRIIIFVPMLSEQIRISSVLANIDLYIHQQYNHKRKLDELRKGLMQNLLTGKIRVKS